MIRITLLTVFVILLLRVTVFAEEHKHGVNVPDWYDPACCNLRDCHPVDNPNDIEPLMHGTEPVLRWIPGDIIFVRSKFRKSQDERFHVCHIGTSPMCIYIPAMT